MNVARVRISRVTRKSDGAELRVLPRQIHEGPIAHRIQKWVSSVVDIDAPAPRAFLAISFALPETGPGGILIDVDWDSDCSAFPVLLLPSQALEAIRHEMTIAVAKNATLTSLGYVQSDDPDPAA